MHLILQCGNLLDELFPFFVVQFYLFSLCVLLLTAAALSAATWALVLLGFGTGLLRTSSSMSGIPGWVSLLDE
jgi:hypothetical protein